MQPTPDELARELVKLLPPAPTGLSPIEWVAVFFVALVGVLAILGVLWVLPRMSERAGAAIAGSIAELATELREQRHEEAADRRARDETAREHIATLHQKLDAKFDATASELGSIRREIAGLACARSSSDDFGPAREPV